MSNAQVKISNIRDIIEQQAAKQVLVVFESLGPEEVYEEGKKTLRFKHEDREEIFLNYLTDLGVSREETDRKHLSSGVKIAQEKRISLAIVVGGSAYQNVGLGAQLRKYGFIGQIFVEITKEDASMQRDFKMLLSNAIRYNATDLLHHLVYTTKNSSPKYISLDIPAQAPAKEDAIVATPRRPRKVKKVVPLSFAVVDPPERVRSEVFKIARDAQKAQQLKIRYDCRCQVCGTTIGPEEELGYVECHHIRPLGGNHKGTDSTDNMLILCPNHHAMFDFGLPRFLSPKEVQIGRNVLKLTTHHRISSAATEYHNTFIALQTDNEPKA